MLSVIGIPTNELSIPNGFEATLGINNLPYQATPPELPYSNSLGIYIPVRSGLSFITFSVNCLLSRVRRRILNRQRKWDRTD